MRGQTISELNCHIDKKMQRTYFEVPFDVPENVEKLEVTYSYDRRITEFDNSGGTYLHEINVVDMFLRDQNHAFRGTSGSDRTYFSITENEATPGYVKGKIGAGQWALILGAYKIMNSGCDVGIKITFTAKQRVLLKGDLHMHSLNSDGRYSVDEIIKIAKRRGLDYIFLTDHNNYVQNSEICSSDELVVMPGMEWTHYEGHANFLGVYRPVTNIISNDKQTTVSIINSARKNGAVVFLNHPMCNSCPWKWGFDVPFDGIEIWNGPIKDSDYDAIKWWHGELKGGRHIPAVGGSDSHRDEFLRMIGTPTTFVYSESRGESDIIAAIRAGSVFISYSPDGPVIELSVDGFSLGQTAPKDGPHECVLSVSHLNRTDVLKLLSDEGEEKEFTVASQSAVKLSQKLRGTKFVRAEVWRTFAPGVTMLAAVSNPVYLAP